MCAFKDGMGENSAMTLSQYDRPLWEAILFRVVFSISLEFYPTNMIRVNLGKSRCLRCHDAYRVSVLGLAPTPVLTPACPYVG